MILHQTPGSSAASPAELTSVWMDNDAENCCITLQEYRKFNTERQKIIAGPTVSLLAGSEEETDDVQPKICVKWIADAYNYFIPGVDDQTATTLA